ncbi:MAG: gliding motility-associated ABC transporter ATP-binding subunit GldA [Flavobacteriaceae bacterium]|nr:gliding motility-associated ABC transporter ATP-binding subunit GldA [Flavobacteriaceae bacterium]
MSIEVAGVSKLYANQKALNSVSFTIKKGSVVGFLGPNGAGKSTMMKILTGFISPSEGTVFVNGINVIDQPIEAQKCIGYLPEHNPLYTDMYVKEYLQFQAAVYSVKKEEVNVVIAKVGLEAEAHKKINQLSKGYQQRVGLAAALLHNPEVLILDEPTTGLDPNQLVEIRALIKEIGTEKTVLFSTHILQEVEAICDRVIIINKGELIIDKPLSEIRAQQNQMLEVIFDYKIEEQFIKKLPHLVDFKNNYDTTWKLTFKTSEDMRPVVFDFAQENGLKILGLNAQNQNLENLFRTSTNN